MSQPRTSRPTALAGLGLAVVLTLGACSTSGSSGASSSAARGSSSGVAAGGADAAAATPGSPEAADGSSAASPGSAGAPAGASAKAGTPVSGSSAADLVAADKLVRTASLQVQVDDVAAGAADVRRIAVAAGGMVVSENSSAVPSGGAKGSVDKEGSRSVLALAVPSDSLDRVLDDVGKLGTTVQRSSSSRDVTSTYVDTQSRIATMKASLDQLRALLAKTTSIDQVVSLETEASRRQADLDSLQAQLNALDKKVSMSTLTVNLATAAQVVAQEDSSGFLGGLRHGWAAFLTTFGGVLTVLGALLPFLVLVALVGGPIYVWWRRRRAAGRRQIEATPGGWDGRPNGGGHGGPSGPGSSGGTGGSGGSGSSGGPGGSGGSGGSGGLGGLGGLGGSGGSDGPEGPSGTEPERATEETTEHEPEPVGAR